MAWRGWNKNEYPYNNGVLNDNDAFDIICRKFNEYLKYKDYNFTALTYYLKMLFENGNMYVSYDISKQLESLKINPSSLDYNNRGVKDSKWEHVIPIKVMIEYSLYLFTQGLFTQPKYVRIRNTFGNVCIVTSNENKALNSAGLRQILPQGATIIATKSNNPKVPNQVYELNSNLDPFCRYNNLNPKIVAVKI